MQKEMQNHEEDVCGSSVLSEHHEKVKFRDSSKDLKFVKMRNTFRRHTYGNQVKLYKLIIIYILKFFSKFTKYNVLYDICLVLKSM
jgi:hypothetical protein